MVIAGTINEADFIHLKRLFCIYKVTLLNSIITVDNKDVKMSDIRETLLTHVQSLMKSFTYPAMSLEVGETKLLLRNILEELTASSQAESNSSVTPEMLYDYPNKEAFFKTHIREDNQAPDDIDTVITTISKLINLALFLFSRLTAYIHEPSTLPLEKCIRFINILELLDATLSILEDGNIVFEPYGV